MRRCTSRQADQPMFDREYPKMRCERASTVTSISQPWNPEGVPSLGFCGRNHTYTSLVDVLSILRGSPNASCSTLTGLPTLSAAIRGTGRTAYPDPLQPTSIDVPKIHGAVLRRNIIQFPCEAQGLAVSLAAARLRRHSRRKIGICDSRVPLM